MILPAILMDISAEQFLRIILFFILSETEHDPAGDCVKQCMGEGLERGEEQSRNIYDTSNLGDAIHRIPMQLKHFILRV